MKYIISAELSSLKASENKARTLILVREMLELGLDFVAVKGVYKGVAERSFVVFEHGMPTGWILDTMRKFGQESILAIESDNKATLVYADGSAECLGKFQRYEGALDGLDAYAKVADQVWVCA